MTRRHGWARRGARLVAKIPHGHWNTATFLAALRHDRIEAPCLFDGPINGQRFRAYVEQFLVPTLKAGDVVILDNLGSHKGKVVRQAVRKAGARLLFLPKYSPDLNPIEQLFAKLKTLLRKAAARTLDAVCAAVGQILDSFTPQECANYFRNAGYAST
jgi:putative transposase